jgi:hypothetical protein
VDALPPAEMSKQLRKYVIHREFGPEGQTVNGQFYLGVMERLLKRIRRVHPEFHNSKEWFFLHDSAPTRTAGVFACFLIRKQVTVLHHPSYSTDLAPADFFLFPKLITIEREAFSGHFHNVSKCDRANQEHSERLV